MASGRPASSRASSRSPAGPLGVAALHDDRVHGLLHPSQRAPVRGAGQRRHQPGQRRHHAAQVARQRRRLRPEVGGQQHIPGHAQRERVQQLAQHERAAGLQLGGGGLGACRQGFALQASTRARASAGWRARRRRRCCSPCSVFSVGPTKRCALRFHLPGLNASPSVTSTRQISSGSRMTANRLGPALRRSTARPFPRLLTNERGSRKNARALSDEPATRASSLSHRASRQHALAPTCEGGLRKRLFAKVITEANDRIEHRNPRRPGRPPAAVGHPHRAPPAPGGGQRPEPVAAGRAGHDRAPRPAHAQRAGGRRAHPAPHRHARGGAAGGRGPGGAHRRPRRPPGDARSA